MFFRRQEGEYRETDRVTRFKLIKSGKHWLRASTSQFGLFKVLRGGVDTAQVTTEVIEEQASTTLTGLDILKGIAAAGTVFGGAVATTTHVYAEETTQALEKEVNTADALATVGSAVLGNKSELGSESVITNSQSDSQEVSLSASVSESIHVSETASKSLKESESAKTSLETSLSASKAISESGLGSGNVIASILGNGLASQAPVNGSVASKTSLSNVAEESTTGLKEVDETAQTSQASQASRVSTSATENASELSLVIENSLNSLATIDAKLSSLTVGSTALIDTTITAAVATTVTAENDKKAQEDRKRLSKISAEMGEYLAKSVGLPNTEAAVAKVNAAVTAIEGALKTPNADLTDVIKQATIARNSIINAVQRANNGQRSSLNGKAMERGANFRVAPGGATENDPDKATYGFRTATVGYVVTSADAKGSTSLAGPNAKYSYKEGTYLYATQGRQANDRAPGSLANVATRVEVKDIASQVYMKAVRNGTTTHWEVLFNDGGEPHDNPYFYFTVPKGHRITHMKVEQKDGGNRPWNTLGETDSDEAFRNNSKSGDLLAAIGNANNNQGGAYYENVAGVGPSGVGRGTLTSLRDFAFNNPDAYYQTDKITDKVKKEGDFAFNSIEGATANVYALHPKGSARYEGYRITYTTESAADTNDYYMAGFRSLENSRHRNYLQMVGSQDRYRAEFKGGEQSSFLKFSGVEDLSEVNKLIDLYDVVTGQKLDEFPPDFASKVKYKIDGAETDPTYLGITNLRTSFRPQDKLAKGTHKLTITFPNKGGKTQTYDIPFRVVTQSEVYQPTINTNALNRPITKGQSVPSAASMISGFTNSSSTIPNFKIPSDMQSYKDNVNDRRPGDVIPPERVSGTATSASNLNVANVQWLGGGDTFGSGVGENMAIKATVNGKTVYLPLPSDMPASKLGQDLTPDEVTKVLEHNGLTTSTATIASRKVGLSKTLVVTYKDNENGDSQDTSEVFFENIAKATTPTAPAIQAPTDGSVTVTPQGESDSVTITYTPTTGNTNTTTTISVKKSGTKWDNPEPLPSGVTLNKDTGAVTISEPTVRDESRVTATAYNFNSEGATSTETAKMPYKTKSDRFYAVQGENANQLTASDFITNSSGAAVPSTVTVEWKTRPDFSSNGEKTAVLTVTSSGITKDFNYPYTVYKKIETVTNNGVTGQFYAFKADASSDKTSGGSWANNIGGNTSLYTNSDDLPQNTQWRYEYQLNGTGTLQKTPDGRPDFSAVWNNNQAHRTQYRVVATYPTGRFGTPTTQNPALTSQTSFTYTVVDPVAKQTYETTAGDMTPLSAIKTTPGQAVTNATNPPTVPTGTDFAWETPISDSDISTPGYVTKKVKVTLPKGSANQTDTGRNSKLVPVTIKVNPQAPQIADNQLTNTGGLPNRGITVTNVTPGATVTLTLGSGSKTVMKTVPANATSLTIGASDLADSNGLLPVGEVTVKQSKQFTNPTTNRTETLESATTTKTITKENVKPVATTVVEVYNNATKTWEAAPKTTSGDTSVYTFYAGDHMRFTTSITDNSNYIKQTDIKIGGSDGRSVPNRNAFDDSFGNAIVTNISSVTPASSTTPAKVVADGTIKEELQYSTGNTSTRSITATDISDNESIGNTFKIVQGDLAVRNANLNPDKKIKVTNLTALTEDEKTSIKEAIKNAHDTATEKEKDRIKDVTFEGPNAKITYKDGRSRTKPISELAREVNTPSIENLAGRGGLPNQTITVNNVLPGATVTLTVAGQTLTPKRAADNATSVTFTAADLGTAYTANNGLLPSGSVTATQSVPAGANTTEVLTSDQGTGTITNETERPNVEVVLQVKDGDNWVDQTRKAVRNSANDEERRSGSGYELFAGDEYRFVIKTTDNSGKVRTVEVWDGGRYKQSNMTGSAYNRGGAISHITTPTTATTETPATLTIQGTYNENQQYAASNLWTRQIRTEDLSGNTNNDTTFQIVQGKLSDKFQGKQPEDAVPVADPNSLTGPDRDKILEAVKRANPQDTNRISNYTIDNNGRVTITYKDGTSNPVDPKVKPQAPTINPANQAVYGDRLTSTDRVITGTNAPGATVEVTLQDGTKKAATVNGTTWTLNLGPNEVLTQSEHQNLQRGDSKAKGIEVTQTVNGLKSDIASKAVTLGDYTIQPSRVAKTPKTGDKSNSVASAKDVVVQIPHDAGLAYVRLNGNQDLALQKQPNGTWNVAGVFAGKVTAVETAVAGDPTKKELTISVNDPTNPPYRIQKGTDKVQLLVKYADGGQEPPAAKDWVKADAINEKPAITANTGSENKVYIAGTPVTQDDLKNLVTVSDQEDLNTTVPGATVGKKANENLTVEVVKKGTTAKITGNLTDPGVYTVTYKTSDAAGDVAEDKTFDIVIKPQAPQIADDQLTEKGGLPNRSIEVTNVTPGATVTLTIGTQTFTKTAGPNDTRLTFEPRDLAAGYNANNGLLPTGRVTIKQALPNPTSSQTNPLESETTTKTITKEMVPPNVTVKVEVYNPKTNTWVEAPKYSDGKSKIYAGDKFRVMVVTTDNSGKVRNIEAWNDNNGNGNPTTTSLIGTDVHSGGSAVSGGTGGNFPASDAHPQNRQVITDAVYNSNKQYRPDGDGSKATDNEWTRYVRVKDFSDNETRVPYGIRQAPLSEKYDPATPDTIQVTNKTNPSEKDQEKIREAVRTKNAGLPIDRIDVAADGSVTVVYTDGTKESRYRMRSIVHLYRQVL